MATKKKTPKTRTRTKAALAAEAQPAAQAAPQPAPLTVQRVESDIVGFRTPDTWGRRDRNPRPIAELTKTGTLIRGISWTISYSSGPVVFAKGKPVPITEVEFQSLQAAVDKIDFPDGSGERIIRSIRKFIFHDIASGDLIELEPLPDVTVGEYAMSLGDKAALERLPEGEEHTAR